jgi:hypothetical protein
MNTTSPRSLLELNAELRPQIYNDLIRENPWKVLEEFSGLLYSCQTIRREFEPETCRAIAECVDAIAARTRLDRDDIIYTSPATIYS